MILEENACTSWRDIWESKTQRLKTVKRTRRNTVFKKNPSEEEKAEELAFEKDFFFFNLFVYLFGYAWSCLQHVGSAVFVVACRSEFPGQGLTRAPCVGIVESSPPRKSQKANFLKFPIRCYKKMEILWLVTVEKLLVSSETHYDPQ